ncbi:MAG: isopenicillin N synthase family oxygenase [Cytophagales bacterium]|nr:MAG: isopenicillin N synthase family oxygenase [Cytophagales bacterium]TAF61853.1 MAG: isopenicillin N synthase family oxygenase [Cytophagales bacterium]
MSDMLFEEIPSLDLAHFTQGSAAEKNKFVQDLGAAFENIGFVAIKNHGFSDAQRDELYKTIINFFSLPDNIKYQYERPDTFFQRGYIGHGREQAKDHPVPDLKEFFHVGQEFDDSDVKKDMALAEFPPNVWVQEMPALEAVTVQAFKILEEAGKNLLRAIALYLKLPENYFDSRVERGNSILRPIHYYPITQPELLAPDAVRAAAHGDINLITLLMGASADGLQVLRRDGKWISVTALPEQVVVNVGDMLSRHTNNKLKSTIHRVVNPPRDKMNSSRYSIPFFMHPRSEMDLTCLPNCIDAQNPKLYESITAGDFLQQRLAEIGLANKK